ncbi:MAG: formylglycine-generating enzyme family protein [Treponema sp.]|nr:formylglycine-generating enzyme family protein [Treponema sp.]
MNNRIAGLGVLLLTLYSRGFAQEQNLPRLAVVEFNVNMDTPKVNRDAVTVRNLVESQMVAAGKYQVITRTDIDQLLANQQIQVSSISSAENIRKLQLQNISYIVTGSLDALDEDYAVTLRNLDVSTGRFSHSANGFMGSGSRDIYNGVTQLASSFAGGMTTQGGQVAQAGSQKPKSGVSPADIGARFSAVPGGPFLMGSVSGDSDEKPVHTVTVSGFYMGKYEVTQREWQEVMGNNPANFKGDDLPVENVSWYEAIEYCNKRSVREGLTPAYRGSGASILCDFRANGYRLPTEAEWEYAAKEGNQGGLTYEYSGSNSVDAAAWYSGNSGNRTHAVGTKQPNSLGLYDMSGNVWEWCWDWYGSYSGGSQTDPAGPASGSGRVLRGGSWSSSAQRLRSAYRRYYGPSYRYYSSGFRLVRVFLP